MFHKTKDKTPIIPLSSIEDISTMVNFHINKEIDEIKKIIEELILKWKSEIEIFDFFNIHVEEITMWNHQNHIDDFNNDENISPELKEKADFEKEISKMELNNLIDVEKINEINEWMIIELDIKWFLRFIIKIKSINKNNWKQYANCIINGIKLIKQNNEMIEKYFINHQYTIEFPLEKKWELTLTDQQWSNITIFRIIWIKQQPKIKRKIPFFLSKLIK